MSIYKQKYFLFFLVLLFNKYILIFGGWNLIKDNNTNVIQYGSMNPFEEEKENEKEVIKEFIPEKEIFKELNEKEEIIVEIEKYDEEKEKTKNNSQKPSVEINEENEREKINNKNIDKEEEKEQKENEEKEEKRKEKEKVENEKEGKEKEENEKEGKEYNEKEEKEKEKEIPVNQDNNSPELDYDIMRYDGCEDIQPTNGVREECTESYKFVKNRTCCFMTVKYKYNNYYTCIRIPKDIKIIKPLIKELKGYYEGCNSIQIDCHSNIIKYSFLLIAIFLVL